VGLKTIGFASYKSGKTVFGLTMAEVGNIGVVDTESRVQWYTIPHPNKTKEVMFPYNNPRLLRPDLHFLPKTENIIYLVETMELGVAGKAIQEFSKNNAIVGMSIDSGSILWDELQATRDDSDPKMSMLSWTPIKRTNRRLLYAMTSGNKHVFLSAHAQVMMKKVGSELVETGIKPWLEKKTPHWADIVLEFNYPDDAPYPAFRVAGEGIGGAGGLTRGKIVEDPTFKKLLDRITYTIPDEPESQTPDEIEYRNRTVVEGTGKSKPVPGVDDAT
jgi:hypothetical protein